MIILRFNTEDLLPSTECDGGMQEPHCYCPGDCLDDEGVAEGCLCTLGSECYCGCDPNADIDDYRMRSIEELVGCKEGQGWFLVDSGDMDTAIQVMDGYEVTEMETIVPAGIAITEEMLTRVYNDVEAEGVAL